MIVFMNELVFKHLLERSPLNLFVCDFNGNILNHSKYFLDLFSIDNAESMSEIFPSFDAALSDNYKKISTEEEISISLLLKNHTTTYRVNLRKDFMYGMDVIVGFVTESSNVAGLLSTLFNISTNGIIVYDLNGSILYRNKYISDLFGYNIPDFVNGDNETWLITDQDGISISKNDLPFHKTIKETHINHYAISLTEKNKRSTRHYTISGSLVVNKDFNEEHLLVFMVDVTVLIETDKELKVKQEDEKIFAKALSHDLRTPVRGIEGLSSIILEDYPNLPSEVIDYIRRINMISLNLGKLIEDSYDQIMFGKHSNFVKVNIVDCINESIDIFNDKGVKINKVFDDPSKLFVFGDRLSLTRVFINLIENAIKYNSKEKKLIEIRLIGGFDNVIVSVKDNGDGIDSRYHSDIFKLYTRLRSDVPGSGLGLALCKRVMDRHSGTIKVYSEVGNGSKFIITIPKRLK